ncbi:hypothetical protein GCM10020370_23820 [Paenibacillus hodogayensis]
MCEKSYKSLQQTTPPNITYKIQELHVNELKGTLNIGLTSTGTAEQLRDMIEKMKTDQGHIAENMAFSPSTDNPRKSALIFAMPRDAADVLKFPSPCTLVRRPISLYNRTETKLG